MLLEEGLKKEVLVSLIIEMLRGVMMQLEDMLITVLLFIEFFSFLEIILSFRRVMGNKISSFLTYSLKNGFYSTSKSFNSLRYCSVLYVLSKELILFLYKLRTRKCSSCFSGSILLISLLEAQSYSNLVRFQSGERLQTRLWLILSVMSVSRMAMGWRWMMRFLERLSSSIEVSSSILKSSTSSNYSKFILLSTRLLILSTRLLVSQNIAHFRIRLLSSLTSSFDVFLVKSWEPSRKSSLLLALLIDSSSFFFLNAFDIQIIIYESHFLNQRHEEYAIDIIITDLSKIWAEWGFLLQQFAMQKQQVPQNIPPSSESEGEEQNNTENKEQGATLTKRQLKKIQKKEKWEKEKLIKRQEKRQRQKEKKKLKKMQQQQHKPEHAEKPMEIDKGQLLMKKRKDDYQQKMKEGVKVVIDLQFYDLMTEKQQSSLIKQLGYCHSVNRKSEKCFNYILTSATQERQLIFSQRYNANNWGISMEEKSLLDLYPKEQIIYLTGDAEEEIQDFQPDFVYIIGGIVDHNRLKKITYNFAVQNEIKARRMPMKNVQLKASVHLAVNHIWQWMLKRYNGAGWDQALKSVLPQRKLQNYKEQ